MLTQINATYFACAILISSTIFVIAWSLDAITHSRLVKIDISDKELQTHRILILSSGLMELCLVLMYWFDIEILPIFIAAVVTRTAHEFIDELRYHTDRCTFRETLLHLIMWITVISKTSFLFIWGFFTHYQGLEKLHPAFYIWGILIIGIMSITSVKEWRQGK